MIKASAALFVAHPEAMGTARYVAQQGFAEQPDRVVRAGWAGLTPHLFVMAKAYDVAMKSVVLVAFLLFSPLLAAATVQVGAPLPALTFKDQHDVSATITTDTRFLIFVAERAASTVVETALEGQTATTLAAAKVRYVADISAMPGIVTTVIALPQMRKRPYPMLLGRSADATSMLPREPGKVTLIESANGRILAVRFIADVATLRAALGLAP